MGIEVTSYSPVNDPNSNVVGYVNFYVHEWGMHLNGCKYIRNRNGGFFVGFPSKEYKNDAGETKYAPYYCFKGENSRNFQEGARKAIEDWGKNNGYE